MKAQKEIENADGPEVLGVYVKDGIKLILEGHEYPFKGLPTLEAIDACNEVKRMWKRFLRGYIDPFIFYKSNLILKPHALSMESLNPCARELTRVLPTFLHFIPLILEYDWAYRLRFQDLMSETTLQQLYSPHKEIKRLLAINKSRDYIDVSRKIALLNNLLWVFYIPPVLHYWRKFITKVALTQLKLDEIDRYWASIKTDYNYG